MTDGLSYQVAHPPFAIPGSGPPRPRAPPGRAGHAVRNRPRTRQRASGGTRQPLANHDPTPDRYNG
jgi:hypothetical protein